MIVILKKDPDQGQLEGLISWLEDQHIQVHPTVGAKQTILGLVGDTSSVDMDLISALDIVDDVKRVQEPYKNPTANSTRTTRSSKLAMSGSAGAA